MNEIYTCPECGSSNIGAYEKTLFKLNSCEFYCASVKLHDSDAEAVCMSGGCAWRGEIKDLVIIKE